MFEFLKKIENNNVNLYLQADYKHKNTLTHTIELWVETMAKIRNRAEK